MYVIYIYIGFQIKENCYLLKNLLKNQQTSSFNTLKLSTPYNEITPTRI